MMAGLLPQILVALIYFTKLAMPTCVKPLPLGLENREIENSQMAASNALKSTNNTASEARINVGNGWCTKNVNSPYIIIDLGSMVTVTSITTQGGMVQNKTYFTSKYAVQFGYTNSAWYSYFEMNESKEFDGNKDANATVSTIGQTMARYIKVIPKFLENQTIACLRMEVYGCKSALKPNMVVSPQALILKTAAKEIAYCNISGQVEMSTSIQKPIQDVFMTEELLSNQTFGLRHDISRKLWFEHKVIQKFDTACSLEKSQSVVVCRKIYTCKASYSFLPNMTTAKSISVAVHQDLTLKVKANEGQLSPVHVEPKKQESISCEVISQDKVSVEWINRQHNDWKIETVLTIDRNVSHLSYKQVKMLKLKPNAADVIGILNCQKGVEQVGKLECQTKFVCQASYTFNKAISEESEVEIIFDLKLPSKPSSPSESCRSNICDITWSNNQLGDIPSANIFYSVIVIDVSTNENKIQDVTQDTKYTAKGLMPYTSYVVKLKTQVKKTGGFLIWESKEETRQFKTTTVAPRIAPKILTPIATSDSIEIRWEPLKLPQGSGYILKYELIIQMVRYGGRAVGTIPGMDKFNPVFKSLLNKTTSHTFRKLKPWSQFQVTIKAVNNDGLSGLNSNKFVNTEESIPAKPPSIIFGGSSHPNYIKLHWTPPPFKDCNGAITEYQIRWKEAYRTRRMTRNTPEYKKITKGPDLFKCQNGCEEVIKGLTPYKKYSFQIAAGTKIGLGNFSDPKEFLTAQAAPTAPLSPGYNENKKTFYLLWKEPAILNGVLKEYEIKLELENGKILTRFTESTALSYDTKINSSETLKFKVRGYTESFHNDGGLAGEWTKWTVARRYFVPTKAPVKPGNPEAHGKDPVTTIVVTFVVILVLLIVLSAVLFVLYRRRQEGGSRRKLEVEMDSVVDEGEGEDVNLVPGERRPLTQHLGSHETVDVQTEDHAHLPISVDEFGAYVNRMREGDDEMFYNEYKNELMSGKCYSTEISLRPENKMKNRYANITAYDHSRVILKPEGGKRSSHHRESDYFNANYIEGYCLESTCKYIASQGPMESVTPAFWRMIWQENANVIVMLTNLEEVGKVKCHQYWPSQGTCKYGNITVRFRSSDQTADYIIRAFEIEKGGLKDKEKRSITQFHFISWPDHGVPDFPTAILSLRRRVRQHYSRNAPMIVHCSAGVGRTGCFILIDAMLERIENGEGTVDIFNYLQYMRTRRINMVQTLDQYIFAHTAILEYLTFGDTEISVIDLEKRVKELKRDNGMVEEFALIESTSPDIESIDNSYKVLLKNGKFLDIFYIDGYKQRDAFFLCNSPSQTMAADFWKMLVERDCHTVVMLNRLEDEENFKYWPDMNTHHRYGDSTVVMTSENQSGNIITRKFKITESQSPEEEFEVQHFQFVDWPSGEVPESRSSIITLMSSVEKSRQNYGNGPVLVHSGNGAGRSGTFIAIYNSTERLKLEQLIDVLQCVRAIKAVVPNAVETSEQYEFIYKMIRQYLEAFETYANFELSTESL